MKRAHMIAALTAQLLVAGFAEAIQTGKVDLGAQGSYDGTVWITRDTSGSMVFHDQRIGTSVTLSQLHSAQRDHGGLSGLADDDHSHYLNWARHWQTHTAD
ncbi:hypothetical protein FJY63_05480, partial [Candidatus Sumerlaeota bacterium]|nr:hypothetical protein [Candidatus Sumerlaeota bacterium]